MTVTTLTVTSVAALPIDGQIDNGPPRDCVHIRRTTAEHWDLWTDGHQVTVHRDERSWLIAERWADQVATVLGVKSTLFDAVALALAAL